LRLLLQEADHVFAMSADLAELVERLAPVVPAESMTNAVDVSVFSRCSPCLQPAPGPRLVVPSRLQPVKGVEYFVRAMPEVAAALPGVEAVLVGDGPERKPLEELSARLGVAERIRFLGARPNAEMPAILSSATAAVIPSLMEATSIAALEAMACELPVAASRVGGLPEIVDESVGTLFGPGDPADLARRLVALLRRTDLGEVGRRGRDRVATRWSNDLLVERHLEVYRALRAGERPNRA
jgi:glycosyltransferase involved in cell wall biosynthesis